MLWVTDVRWEGIIEIEGRLGVIEMEIKDEFRAVPDAHPALKFWAYAGC